MKVEEDFGMQGEEGEVTVKTEKGIACKEEECIDIKDEEGIYSEEEEEEDMDIKEEEDIGMKGKVSLQCTVECVKEISAEPDELIFYVCMSVIRPISTAQVDHRIHR